MSDLVLCSFSGDSSEDDNDAKPSRFDYFMHCITLFWKLLFAFIPPAGKLHSTLPFQANGKLIFLPQLKLAY